jgi:hypothetical protein
MRGRGSSSLMLFGPFSLDRECEYRERKEDEGGRRGRGLNILHPLDMPDAGDADACCGSDITHHGAHGTRSFSVSTSWGGLV